MIDDRKNDDRKENKDVQLLCLKGNNYAFYSKN